MNWADYALDLEERLDAANRGRQALATELAALKARRCAGCAWYWPCGPFTSTGVCALSGGDAAGPSQPDQPHWARADCNDDYSSWLLVNADHACNAWTPKAGQ